MVNRLPVIQVSFKIPHVPQFELKISNFYEPDSTIIFSFYIPVQITYFRHVIYI